MIKNTIGASLLALGLVGATSSQALVVFTEDFNSTFLGTSGYIQVPQPGDLTLDGRFGIGATTALPSVHHSWSQPGLTPFEGARFMIVNGDDNTATTVWASPAIVVGPNANLFFEAALANIIPTSPAILKFEYSFNNSTWNTLTPSGSVPGYGTGSWQTITAPSFNTAANTTVYLRLVNNNGVLNGNDFGVDLITLANEPRNPSVPEVSTGISAGVFALVGGLIVLRRRKAAQVA